MIQKDNFFYVIYSISNKKYLSPKWTYTKSLLGLDNPLIFCDECQKTYRFGEEKNASRYIELYLKEYQTDLIIKKIKRTITFEVME